MIAYREQSHLKVFEHCVTKEKRFGYKYSCLLNKIFFINCILFRCLCYTVEKAYLTDKNDFLFGGNLSLLMFFHSEISLSGVVT